MEKYVCNIKIILASQVFPAGHYRETSEKTLQRLSKRELKIYS